MGSVKDLLTKQEIKELVRANMDNRVSMDLVKELKESGAMPRLEGAEAYYGKVRANFSGPELVISGGIPLRVIIATDNLSTHDKVRGTIPFKGQILTELSDYMLDVVKGTLPSSQLATPGPNVIIAENCKTIDFEMVLRKYMAKTTTKTSLHYHYVDLGEREFAGHKLPDGLKPNQMLPYLMDTPSTKAREGGHDVSVPPGYLFEQDIISPKDYVLVRNDCMKAFGKGEAILAQRGILLVDTKFEIGINSKGEIVYIDEVLTQDASRYWLADDYEEKFAKGEDPTSYSKQLARDIGKPGEPFTEEETVLIACRYIESYQLLTEKRFVPDMRDVRTRIVEDVNKGLDDLLN